MVAKATLCRMSGSAAGSHLQIQPLRFSFEDAVGVADAPLLYFLPLLGA
jgi:hypothetical protein